VIVRISTEDQFELSDDHAERLNELDNAIVDAVAAGRPMAVRRTTLVTRRASPSRSGNRWLPARDTCSAASA